MFCRPGPLLATSWLRPWTYLNNLKTLKKINFKQFFLIFKKHDFNRVFKHFMSFLDNLMALEGDLGYLIAFSDFLGKEKKKKKNKIDVRQESTICWELSKFSIIPQSQQQIPCYYFVLLVIPWCILNKL